jgi:hypothetical protein
MVRLTQRALCGAALLLVLFCAGCSPTRPDPVPALKDTGETVQPVRGCQDLRARGGSC